MSLQNHLVVLARAPRLGAVKRRLAADIGAVAAWRFHRIMLEALLRRLAPDPRWRCWLALTPDRFAAHDRLPLRGLRLAPTVIAQGSGDIGRRMARPFASLPPGPVVLVGCDVPGIAPAHIARAFALLGHHDVVFGPAGDGGYWLVGARRRPHLPDLFGGVRWSSAHTLADSLAKVGRGRSVALIETRHDVDDDGGYRRWVRAGAHATRIARVVPRDAQVLPYARA